MSVALYRRPGETKVRQISPEALTFIEKIGPRNRAILEQLKSYEPGLFNELRYRLGEHERSAIAKSVELAFPYLKHWTCPLCESKNKVPKKRIEEIIRRLKGPKVTNIQYTPDKGFERRGIDRFKPAATAQIEWRDPKSEDSFCESCLEVCIVSLRLPFNPLHPTPKPKEPKVVPHWNIKPQGVMKGELETLRRPSEASVEMLQRIIKKYRDRDFRKVSIGLNELRIREVNANG